jgi:hypothetical protein
MICFLTQMLGEVSGASSYMFFHNLQSNENQRNITLSEPVPKFNRNIVERVTFDIPSKHVHDRYI